jgi:hypothetical protein
LQQPAAKLPLPIWVFMISSHLRPFAFIRGSAFFFKESAGLFADQNMERDAPWTAWSKMLQLRGRNGFFNPRSTIFLPLRVHLHSFAVKNSFDPLTLLRDLGVLAVNHSS